MTRAVGNDDDMLGELLHEQERMVEQYEAIDVFKKVPGGNSTSVMRPGSIDLSALPEHLRWLAGLVQHPAVAERARRFRVIIDDPAFQRDAEAVTRNPNFKWLYVGFGAIVVVYLALKARVLAATDKWWLRILLRLALLPVFFFGIFLVMYGVLGKPFFTILWAVEKILV